MSMGKKVYIIVELWDGGNDEQIRAAFTNQKDAKEYADSKQGDWDCYALDLDTEQPDDSMRVWSVEINMGYPNIMRQHYIDRFKPRRNAFYMEREGGTPKLIIFVEANRKSKAFEQASEMYKKILGNPEKYKGYSDVHKRFYTGVGDLYDFATGNRLEEYIRDEQK